MKTLPQKTLSFTGAIMFCMLNVLSAQQVIVPAGGETTGGAIAFSVGQTFFQSFVLEDGQLSEGIQQAFEWYLITAVPGMGGEKPLIGVFPNPATHRITISGQHNLNRKGLRYELFDLVGQRLKSGRVFGPETQVDVSFLFSGIYLLRICEGKEDCFTVKIVKKRL